MTYTIDTIKPIYERKFSNTNNLKILSFFTFNGTHFRTSLMFIKCKKYHKIIEIVTDNQEYWFLAQRYTSKEYDCFSNSIIVELDNESPLQIISLSELENKNSYEIIIVNNKLHIPAETIDSMTTAHVCSNNM